MDDTSAKFNDKGEKPYYIYKPNPLIERDYQIFAYQEDKNDYEPIGNYTVIDTAEAPDLSDKKMMNLMQILNGKEDLMQLGEEGDDQVLFHVVPLSADSVNQKVIFRTYDGDGISQENAILTLDKGVFDYDDDGRISEGE